MRLSELLQAAPELVSAEAATADVDVAGLTADSRRVRPGFLFAALKGVKADGAAFIPQALAAGAGVILAGPDAPPLPQGARAIMLRSHAPRADLARLAARFFPRAPAHIAAVTGTNGKTSTVEFLRQMWAQTGFSAASLGTLGVARGVGDAADMGHTTPDPVAVHEALQRLADEGVTHLAMEASSHGLDQRRLEAVRFEAVAFTNLTRDHLDYHPDFESYFAAKLRLFTELAAPGAAAVINVDSPHGARVEAAARERGLAVLSVGWQGRDIRLRELTPKPASQLLDLLVQGRERKVHLPLAGEFQALNALQALGLALATGVREDAALASLAALRGVRGRMEAAGATAEGAPVFVDYAHTPDGLDKVLRALRPHTRGRVIVVFGCGGDRDAAKRPQMGAVAARLADEVVITDDNPRSEAPAAIRAAVLEGCPDAKEIGDRAAAIHAGVAMLRAHDTLVIAGKGHETGQIIGDRVTPFDDVEQARAALARLREGTG